MLISILRNVQKLLQNATVAVRPVPQLGNQWKSKQNQAKPKENQGKTTVRDMWSKIGTALNIKIDITRPSISLFRKFWMFWKEEHMILQAEKTRERSKLKKGSPHKRCFF